MRYTSGRFVAMSVVAAFTLGVLTATAVKVLSAHQVDKAVRVPVVTEDSPGWDCATMGNRECGPGMTPRDFSPLGRCQSVARRLETDCRDGLDGAEVSGEACVMLRSLCYGV